MTLGRFGGVASKLPRPPSGGTMPMNDLVTEARERLAPSPYGQPAISQQLAQLLAAYGGNLLVNGSFESWSSGTTSAPDGWTLTGAGSTVARNTTSGQIQESLASCNVTAALNTVTRLSQTMTISATQNTRLRSRPVTLSARVLVSTASRVSVEVDDGVVVTASALQHTGSGAFETLFVTITVDSAATQIKASLLVSSGASITATWDAAKLEEGAQATAFTPNARDAFVQPRNVGAGNAITITNGTFTDMTSMSVANVIVDGTQSVLITFGATVKSDTAGDTISIRLLRDATAITNAQVAATGFTAAKLLEASLTWIDSKPAAGNYTYKLQWNNDGGTNIATATDRSLSIAVLPSA